MLVQPVLYYLKRASCVNLAQTYCKLSGMPLHSSVEHRGVSYAKCLSSHAVCGIKCLYLPLARLIYWWWFLTFFPVECIDCQNFWKWKGQKSSTERNPNMLCCSSEYNLLLPTEFGIIGCILILHFVAAAFLFFRNRLRRKRSVSSLLPLIIAQCHLLSIKVSFLLCSSLSVASESFIVWNSTVMLR